MDQSAEWRSLSCLLTTGLGVGPASTRLTTPLCCLPQAPVVASVQWQLLTPTVHSSRSPRRGHVGDTPCRLVSILHVEDFISSSTLTVDSSRHPCRRLLPVSHVFGDSSRLSCFLVAPPAFCKSCGVSFLSSLCDCPFWHSTIPSALKQPTSEVTILAMPSLVGDYMHCITCIAFGSLHALACSTDDLSTHHLVR